MKSTGVVRRVDSLGRVVLPMECRRTLGIKVGDSMEIFVDGGTLIFRKYEPSCIFCGESRNVERFKGKNVCPACMREMASRL